MVVPGDLITTSSKAVLKDINFGKIFPRGNINQKIEHREFYEPVIISRCGAHHTFSNLV